MMNKVYLVGAGPGDPDLITWKGRKLLAIADSVLFDHLANDATISIFGLSGHEVITLRSSGGIATWDLNNESGDRVASGIYVYVVKTADHQSLRGKLAIVR